MNLDSTFRAVVTLLKMLHDTAFTEGVQALRDCGGLDQISSTQETGDEVVKIPDQMFPRSCGHVCSSFNDADRVK